MISSFLLSALLYAAVAGVLTLGSREFRLYNLAAGPWLCIGGWLGAFVYGALTGQSVPVNAWWVLVFALFACVQVLAPLLLGTSLRRYPLLYIFVSLGVAVILTNVGSAYFLQFSGSIIPFPGAIGTQALFVVLCLLAILIVVTIHRRRGWARSAIAFRLQADSGGLRRWLVLVVGVEVVLLTLIGAASFQVHKGLFYATEHLSIIPILAVIVGELTGGAQVRSHSQLCS